MFSVPFPPWVQEVDPWLLVNSLVRQKRNTLSEQLTILVVQDQEDLRNKTQICKHSEPNQDPYDLTLTLCPLSYLISQHFATMIIYPNRRSIVHHISRGRVHGDHQTVQSEQGTLLARRNFLYRMRPLYTVHGRRRQYYVL